MKIEQWIQDPYIIYDDDYSIEEFAYYLFDDVVLQAIKSLSDKMKMTLEWKESILRITEDANTVRILLISEPWI